MAQTEELSAIQSAKYLSATERAERAVEAGELQEAIEIYERALSPLEGYGRVHLRLGQLYLRLSDERLGLDAAELRARAISHLGFCADDQRVDSLDRDLLCHQKFEELTAPLEVLGVERAEILQPEAFRGPLRQGRRLPTGPLKLLIFVERGEQQEIDLQLPIENGRWRWRPALDLSRDRDIEIPEDFIASTVEPEAAQISSRRALLPGILMLGGGVVATTIGILSDLSYSTGLRSGQIFVRPAARGIWISGLLLTGAGAGWLVWKW
ncbi:MAG: hypothetical protein VYD19_08840 [Myxococcota bacterium]|nr:hypothetical protein [Myxococcota bacterium]